MSRAHITTPYLLSTEVTKYEQLRLRLSAEFPDLDDETLRDTLEGLTSLPEMIAEVVRSALIDEAMVAGLKERIKQMKSRLARLELRAERKRSLAAEILSDADIPKITAPDFTISMRASPPAVVVISEADIPKAFWKEQPPKLDRQALLTNLKSGQHVPGVALSNRKPNLSVRTK